MFKNLLTFQTKKVEYLILINDCANASLLLPKSCRESYSAGSLLQFQNFFYFQNLLETIKKNKFLNYPKLNEFYKKYYTFTGHCQLTWFSNNHIINTVEELQTRHYLAKQMTANKKKTNQLKIIKFVVSQIHPLRIFF